LWQVAVAKYTALRMIGSYAASQSMVAEQEYLLLSNSNDLVKIINENLLFSHFVKQKTSQKRKVL
jgi:hypothetical protein